MTTITELATEYHMYISEVRESLGLGNFFTDQAEIEKFPEWTEAKAREVLAALAAEDADRRFEFFRAYTRPGATRDHFEDYRRYCWALDSIVAFHRAIEVACTIIERIEGFEGQSIAGVASARGAVAILTKAVTENQAIRPIPPKGSASALLES